MTLDLTDPTETTATLARLREPFGVAQVKQRTQGGKQLDYITIDATINRLLDVLGAGWSFEVTDTKVIPLDDGKYACTVAGSLYALNGSHAGVGADVASDLDKALKTALAEAIKKAGHQLGIGLYLWDEDARDLLATQRAAVAGDVGSMKFLLVHRAGLHGIDTTDIAAIADFFDVAVDELRDDDTVRSLYSDKIAA